MLVTGHSGQTLDWVARNSDGWIYYPQHVKRQEMLISQWRSTLESMGGFDKPFTQSLYIDLVEDAQAMPMPIHLGYRLGRKALFDLLIYLQTAGLNHVVFNLKYGSRPAADVLEEIGEFILPYFPGSDERRSETKMNTM